MGESMFMESIKSVKDFKDYLKENREKLYANAIDANDITLDDEWMQEDEWDEIYQREVVGNGKV